MTTLELSLTKHPSLNFQNRKSNTKSQKIFLLKSYDSCGKIPVDIICSMTI